MLPASPFTGSSRALFAGEGASVAIFVWFSANSARDAASIGRRHLCGPPPGAAGLRRLAGAGWPAHSRATLVAKLLAR